MYVSLGRQTGIILYLSIKLYIASLIMSLSEARPAGERTIPPDISPGQFPRTIPRDNYPPDNSPSQLGQFPPYRSKPNFKLHNMHTCMHTCIHIYIHAYTHMHAHTHIRIQYIRMHTYIHVHIFMHTYTLVVGILRLESQTKESARRYVIYCVALGHMFLL